MERRLQEEKELAHIEETARAHREARVAALLAEREGEEKLKPQDKAEA